MSSSFDPASIRTVEAADVSATPSTPAGHARGSNAASTGSVMKRLRAP
jgi:hypothetical protein